MIGRFINGYTKESSVWMYPRPEYTAKIIAITYVGPSHILDQEGLIMLDIEVEKLFEPLISRRPTKNGYYIVLAYSDLASATTSGSIIAGSEAAVKLVMGYETTVNEIQHMTNVPTLLNSTSGFAAVYDAIKGKVNYITITETNSNEKYHVQWTKSDIISCLLVTIIPLDELKASWEMVPSSLQLNYAQSIEEKHNGNDENKNNKEIYAVIEDTVLKNTGDYLLTWHVKDSTSNTINVFPSSGTIQPHSSITVKYTIDENSEFDPNGGVAFEAYGENGNCYNILLMSIDLHDISCTANDFHAIIGKECKGLNRKVIFEWNNDTVCKLGRKLPNEANVECSIIYLLLLCNM